LIKTNAQECFTNEKNIIISHSYNDYIHTNNNTLAVISINGITHEKDIPTLTILNTNDEKLPLYYALNDVLNTCENNVTNKYYQINNGSHTSLFENNKNINLLSNQIHYFIDDLLQTNLSKSTKIKNSIFHKHNWFFKNRELTNTSNSNNFFKFLFTEPYTGNKLFICDRYVLYKTKNINITKELDDYYFLNMKYNVTSLSKRYDNDYFLIGNTIANIVKCYFNINIFLIIYYLCEFTVKVFIEELFFKMKLPFIVFEWLKVEPNICVNNSSVICEVFSVSTQDNIVYYKFPSKNKMFSYLLREAGKPTKP
jgi:hypothetical protein